MNLFAIRVGGRLFIMRSTVPLKRSAEAPSALERALGLVGAVKGGPRDVAERHSAYLKAKLARGAARSR
jgi:hypothetical protein